MATIVDNFENTLLVEQDNKNQVIIYDNPDNLIIGGTCRFAFEFDGFTIDDIEDAEFIYKESLALKFVKLYSKDEIDIIEPEDRHIIAYSTLSAEETEQFVGHRTVQIQIKFQLKNNLTIYGEKANLVVISPLDKNYEV